MGVEFMFPVVAGDLFFFASEDVCDLPATAIFSSLPLRARSFVGNCVLSAISATASNTEKRKHQTICLCA